MNVGFVVNLWNSKCVLKSTKKCKKKITQCTAVLNAFNRRDKMTGHFKRMHTENLAQRCDKCMKIVKYLKNHILLHNSNKMHKCNICHQSFSQRNVFRKNILVHSRIHVCDQCEKSASDSSSLKIHMKSHSSERSIKCLKCEKTFKSSSGLFDHNAVKHNKENPFVCKLCDRSFSRSGLRFHMMAHKGENLIFVMHVRKLSESLLVYRTIWLLTLRRGLSNVHSVIKHSKAQRAFKIWYEIPYNSTY